MWNKIKIYKESRYKNITYKTPSWNWRSSWNFREQMKYYIMFQTKLVKSVALSDTLWQNLNHKDKEENHASQSLKQEATTCIVGKESYSPFFFSHPTLLPKDVKQVTWDVSWEMKEVRVAWPFLPLPSLESASLQRSPSPPNHAPAPLPRVPYTALLIHSFNKHSLIVYFVPNSVPCAYSVEKVLGFKGLTIR